MRDNCELCFFTVEFGSKACGNQKVEKWLPGKHIMILNLTAFVACFPTNKSSLFHIQADTWKIGLLMKKKTNAMESNECVF